MHPVTTTTLRRAISPWIPLLLVIAALGCTADPPATAPKGNLDGTRLAPRISESALGSAEEDADAGTASQIILRLESWVSPETLATSFGARIVGSISELRLLLVETDPGGAEALLARASTDPRVEFAEPNVPVQAPEARQSTIAFDEGLRPWSDVIDQDAFKRVGAAEAQSVASGKGVLVAVLDTGVDLDHPSLASRLTLPGVELGAAESPGHDRREAVDTNGDGTVDGAWGHGTHVAGIVLALAPEAGVLPVRVLDSDGVGDAFRVAHGLVAAARRGASVANLSLGMSGTSQAVAIAITYALANGVLVLAPAGNAGAPEIEFPASAPGVLCVAGTDANDRKAAFSSYGPEVDLCAPAVGILSAYPGGRTATWSGTSMAVPFGSGTVALLLDSLTRTGGTPHEAPARMLEGAVSLEGSDPDHHTWLGAGRLSAARSLLGTATTP